MAPMVEAGSLFTISNLADEPPLNPTHSASLPVQKPLVLYIVRVPGSKDVFLTTLKPLQKVVTAQDVESCLYYVHLDSTEDEKLLVPLSTQPVMDEMPSAFKNTSSTAGNVTKDVHVHRKPLPVLNHSTTNDNWTAQPQKELLLHGHGQDHAATRTGVENAISPRMPTAAPLYGPRPMHQRTGNVEEIDQGPRSKRIDVFSGKWSERRPPLPPRNPPQPESIIVLGQDQTQPHFEDNLALGSGKNGSITLIRRYGGMQSNVGKVFYEPRDRPVADGRSPLKSSNGTDLIAIYTPGYGKFAGSCSASPANSCANSEVDSASEPAVTNYGASSPGVCFQRQLYTASPRKRPSLQHRSKLTSSTLSVPGSRSSPAMERRRQQQATEGLGIDGVSPPSSPESPPSTAKGHTFYSPWNGVCEFSTGIAGRSLKCKHTFAHPDSALSSSAAVSELRFNLPSSSALGPPRTPITAETPKVPKRPSIFSRHSRARSESTISSISPHGRKIELEERMDLSLGQERAGGGFGGKHAKLGKLIVEEAGLNMIDLVVAANMALWWKVFENSTNDL